MITINTVPDDKHSAYRPIIWEVETERDDAFSINITSITDVGGFVQLNPLGGTHDYVVDDIITLTEFTNPEYNRRATVTAIGGTTVLTNITFISTDTGESERTLDNFQILADVYTPATTTSTILSVADDGSGFAEFTTAAPHGYVVDDFVLHASTTDYDGVAEITAVDSTTEYTTKQTFTVTKTGSSQFIEKIVTKAAKLSAGVYTWNMEGILQTQVSFDLVDFGLGVIQEIDDSIHEYFINFIEQWDGEDGLPVFTDEAVTTFKKATQITLQHLEEQDLSDFEIGSSSQRFLTDAPKSQTIQDTEEARLGFLGEGTLVIRYERFDKGGSSLGIVTTTQTSITTGRGVVPINSIILGSASTVSRVEVWVATFVGNIQQTEKITYVLNEQCFRDPVRIHWLNQKGEFDQYTFTGNRMDTVSARKTEYIKDLEEGFAVSDRGRTTLSVRAGKLVDIFSEFLPRATKLWLTQLYTSPELYLEFSGQLVAINGETLSQQFHGDELQQMQLRFAMPELIIQHG